MLRDVELPRSRALALGLGLHVSHFGSRPYHTHVSQLATSSHFSDIFESVMFIFKLCSNVGPLYQGSATLSYVICVLSRPELLYANYACLSTMFRHEHFW